MEIVTLASPNAHVLKEPTRNFDLPTELPIAQKIIHDLRETLKLKGAAAGLAGPQIGEGRSVFIFSWNRTPECLQAAINPSFEPVGDARTVGWEGCFSTMAVGDVFQVASIARYSKIKATYFTEEGERVVATLSGFAAKVFQHEYGHLEGKCCTDDEAGVKKFPSQDDLTAFMSEVKRIDAPFYSEPQVMR